MKRENLLWAAAVAVLVAYIGWRELPSWSSVAPWWLRSQLLDGRRLAEIRGRIQEAVRERVASDHRSRLGEALRKRVRCGLRARLAWAVCTPPATPSPKPPAPNEKPLRKDCPECRGTGKVRTGDGISWTTCDRCVPPTAALPVAPPAPPAVPSPKASVSATSPGPAVYMRECGPNGCRMVRVR